MQNNFEDKVEGLTLPISRIITKLQKSRWCGTGIMIDRHKTVESKNRPTLTCQLIFNEGAKITSVEQKSFFTQWCWNNGITNRMENN